jgi:Uma2 family endonuclease
MAVVERTYTADDLLVLSHSPEYSEMRLELSDGELIIMSPASGSHGIIASRLDRLIGNFADEHGLGVTTAAETGYILFKSESGRDTVRAPDVGFVSAAHIADIPNEGYIPFAPDLAVEVMSPNDTASEIQKKVMEYLRAGTRLIWVAYPETRSVTVYTPQGAHIVDENGTLDGGDVLPGFRLAVNSIFA